MYYICSNGNVHVDDRVPSPVPITEPEVAIVPVAAPVEVIEEPEIPEAVVPEPTPQLDTKPEQTTEEAPNEVQPDAPGMDRMAHRMILIGVS